MKRKFSEVIDGRPFHTSKKQSLECTQNEKDREKLGVKRKLTEALGEQSCNRTSKRRQSKQSQCAEENDFQTAENWERVNTFCLQQRLKELELRNAQLEYAFQRSELEKCLLKKRMSEARWENKIQRVNFEKEKKLHEVLSEKKLCESQWEKLYSDLKWEKAVAGGSWGPNFRCVYNATSK